MNIPKIVTAVTHAAGDELTALLNRREAQPPDILFALAELNAAMLAVLLAGEHRLDDAKYREELLMLVDRGTRLALPMLIAKYVWDRSHGQD